MLASLLSGVTGAAFVKVVSFGVAGLMFGTVAMKSFVSIIGGGVTLCIDLWRAGLSAWNTAMWSV